MIRVFIKAEMYAGEIITHYVHKGYNGQNEKHLSLIDTQNISLLYKEGHKYCQRQQQNCRRNSSAEAQRNEKGEKEDGKNRCRKNM